MGHTEDYIRNKKYELEKQRVEIERNKLKVLADIRDVMLALQAMLALDFEEKAESGDYTERNVKVVGEAIACSKNRIEKRWSE